MHELRLLVIKLTALAGALIRHLDRNREQPRPRRYVRLLVSEVRFISAVDKGTKLMPNESLGLDIPAGKIARVQFKPVNEKLEVAKIDGPLEAKVLDDPTAATQPPAEVAVGGVDGLVVDIKLPEAEGSLATVEVGGDVDNDPANREVLTTMITLRRLGEVPGKAVSLGAKPETVKFLGADQFGQFPTTTPENPENPTARTADPGARRR